MDVYTSDEDRIRLDNEWLYEVVGYYPTRAAMQTGIEEAIETMRETYAEQARAEYEAERRAERYWEERGFDDYTGSPEEARDRYFEGMYGR